MLAVSTTLHLMKTPLTLIWLLMSSLYCIADTNYLDPANVLKVDGVLTITDGSSCYVFRTNGTFSSFPVGISGRCFEGTWTSSSMQNLSTFTVEAKMSWMNGEQLLDEYRKIVFAVYAGRKKRLEKPQFGSIPSNEVFECYFIIQELVKIPKPSK
jgi:hypothetical protein